MWPHLAGFCKCAPLGCTDKGRSARLLEENLDKLKLLAQTLLEQETLDAHQAYTLLGMEEPAPSRSEADLASDFDDPVAEALKKQEDPAATPSESAS